MQNFLCQPCLTNLHNTLPTFYASSQEDKIVKIKISLQNIQKCSEVLILLVVLAKGKLILWLGKTMFNLEKKKKKKVIQIYLILCLFQKISYEGSPADCMRERRIATKYNNCNTIGPEQLSDHVWKQPL